MIQEMLLNLTGISLGKSIVCERSWSSQAGVIADRSMTEPQWLSDNLNRD